MTNLFARMDAYAIALLDEAEGGGCDNAQPSDTSVASENGSGSAPPSRVSLTDRVAVMKAVTAYLAFREKLPGGTPKEDPSEGEPEPMIVRFERSLKPRNRRTTGG